MKEKIKIFIIGVLVGAVLSTGAFYIYTATTNNNCGGNNIEMNGGQPPDKPDGEPPDKPDGESDKPDGESSNKKSKKSSSDSSEKSTTKDDSTKE